MLRWQQSRFLPARGREEVWPLDLTDGLEAVHMKLRIDNEDQGGSTGFLFSLISSLRVSLDEWTLWELTGEELHMLCCLHSETAEALEASSMAGVIVLPIGKVPPMGRSRMHIAATTVEPESFAETERSAAIMSHVPAVVGQMVLSYCGRMEFAVHVGLTTIMRPGRRGSPHRPEEEPPPYVVEEARTGRHASIEEDSPPHYEFYLKVARRVGFSCYSRTLLLDLDPYNLRMEKLDTIAFTVRDADGRCPPRIRAVLREARGHQETLRECGMHELLVSDKIMAGVPVHAPIPTMSFCGHGADGHDLICCRLQLEINLDTNDDRRHIARFLAIGRKGFPASRI